MESLMRIATLALLGSLMSSASGGSAGRPGPPWTLGLAFGFGGRVNLTDTFGGGSLWGFSRLRAYRRLAEPARAARGGVVGMDRVARRRGLLARQSLGAAPVLSEPEGRLCILKGGLGFSYVTTSISSSTTIDGVFYFNSVSESSGGFGATAGVGLRRAARRNIYLVPAVDWYLQAVGTRGTTRVRTLPGTNNQIAFSLGLVWH
jgi:hypothetical protein